MPVNKIYYVYLHILKSENTSIHDIFYVGKGNSNRIKYKDRPHNLYHTRYLNKHGTDNIEIRFLECDSESHAFELEVSIIKILKSLGVCLTNMTDGGEGASGYKHTEESKDAMSKSAAGRVATPEQREMLYRPLKEYRSCPNNRLIMNQRIADYYNVPENKIAHSERLKFAMSNEDVRKKMSDSAKLRFSKESEKIKKSEERIAYYNNHPEARELASIKAKKQFESEEVRKKASDRAIKLYEDFPEKRKLASDKQKEFNLKNPMARQLQSVKLALIWCIKSGRDFCYVRDGVYYGC
jgi:hypothetical protein